MNDDHFKKIFSSLKKQFEAHLLGSEDGYTQININKDYNLEVPNDLPKINKSIGANRLIEYFQQKGKGLLERKVLFKHDPENLEVRFLIELYRDVNVQAICNINFLSSLRNYVEDFLKASYDKERFFIESKEDEFRVFFNTQPESVKNYFKNRNDTFRIWKYATGTESGKNRELYLKYDFALAKNSQGLCEYVLYSYSGDVSDEIAWLSWRRVDLDFYQNVYDRIKNEIGSESLSVREYLGQ